MKQLALLICCSLATACNQADPEFARTQLGATPLLITTATVRLVTDRPNPTGDIIPNTQELRHVVCAEPSPDVAKALQTATDLSASIQSQGNGNLGVATAEQLAQLTARLPSIQALRDAVYRACEAYANGVLGANAYAMLVSRYGELLVTLMLGENAASNFGKSSAE